jgi:hypothetical protein
MKGDRQHHLILFPFCVLQIPKATVSTVVDPTCTRASHRPTGLLPLRYEKLAAAVTKAHRAKLRERQDELGRVVALAGQPKPKKRHQARLHRGENEWSGVGTMPAWLKA